MNLFFKDSYLHNDKLLVKYLINLFKYSNVIMSQFVSVTVC